MFQVYIDFLNSTVVSAREWSAVIVPTAIATAVVSGFSLAKWKSPDKSNNWSETTATDPHVFHSLHPTTIDEDASELVDAEEDDVIILHQARSIGLDVNLALARNEGRHANVA